MTNQTLPLAWLMTLPGCDGSADWVEIGERAPEPCPPAVPVPLVKLIDAQAMVAAEQNRCAALLNVTRADVSLAAGEMTAQEWRTVAAVLRWMQARIRG